MDDDDIEPPIWHFKVILVLSIGIWALIYCFL